MADINRLIDKDLEEIDIISGKLQTENKTTDGKIDVLTDKIPVDEDSNIKVAVKTPNSFSGDAILSTSYQDDYTVRGNRFLANGVFTLAGSTTVNFLLNLSTVPEGYGIFVLPLLIKSGSEYVKVHIYENTNYSGGASVNAYNVNRLSNDTYGFIITSGATGTSKGTEFITRAVFGSGGASPVGADVSRESGGSNPTIMNPAYNYLVEIENMTSDSTDIEYNADIFEIPFG